MNKAFTLIELTLVVLIVSLVILSVIVGQELVHTAAISKTITSLQQYNTALLAFKNKYSCLPGDCSNADSFGLDRDSMGNINTAQAINNRDGNGNDLLDSVTGMFDNEMANFWVHLSNSGILKEGFTQNADCNGSRMNGDVTYCNSLAGEAFPDSPVGNGIVASSDKNFSKSYFLLGTGSELNIIETNEGDQNSVSANTLTPSDAYEIDIKLDDGIPTRGKVMSYSYLWPVPELVNNESNADSADCYSFDQYNLSVEEQKCSLKVESSY